MKYLRNALYLGILLLALLATGCQMGTAIPPPPPTSAPTYAGPVYAPPPPGAGGAANPNNPNLSVATCGLGNSANFKDSFCANQAAGLGGVTFSSTYGNGIVNPDPLTWEKVT